MNLTEQSINLTSPSQQPVGEDQENLAVSPEIKPVEDVAQQRPPAPAVDASPEEDVAVEVEPVESQMAELDLAQEQPEVEQPPAVESVEPKPLPMININPQTAGPVFYITGMPGGGRDQKLTAAFGISREQIKETYVDQSLPPDQLQAETERALTKLGQTYESRDPEVNAIQREYMDKHEVAIIVEHDMRQVEPLQHPIKGLPVYKQDPDTEAMLLTVDYQKALNNGGIIFGRYIVRDSGEEAYVLVKDMTPLERMRLRREFGGIGGIVPDVGDEVNRFYDPHYNNSFVRNPEYGITQEDLTTEGSIQVYNLFRETDYAIGRHFYIDDNGDLRLQTKRGTTIADDVFNFFKAGLNVFIPKKYELEYAAEKDIAIADVSENRQFLQFLVDGLELQPTQIVSTMKGFENSLEPLRFSASVGDSFRTLANFSLRLPVFDEVGRLGVGSRQPGLVTEDGAFNPEGEIEGTVEGSQPVQYTVSLFRENGETVDYRLGDFLLASAYFIEAAKRNTLEVLGVDTSELEELEEPGLYDGAFFDLTVEKAAEQLGVTIDSMERVFKHPALNSYFTVAKDEAALAAPFAVGMFGLRFMYGSKYANILIDRVQKKRPLQIRGRQEAIEYLKQNPKEYKELAAQLMAETYNTRTRIGRLTSGFMENNVDLYIASRSNTAAASRLSAVRNKFRPQIAKIDEKLSNASLTEKFFLHGRRGRLLFQQDVAVAKAALPPPLVSEFRTELGVVVASAGFLTASHNFFGETDRITGERAPSPISDTMFLVGGGIVGALADKRIASGIENIVALPSYIENISSLALGRIMLGEDIRKYENVIDGVDADVINTYENLMRHLSSEQKAELVRDTKNLYDLLRKIQQRSGGNITEEDIPILLGDILKNSILKGLGNSYAGLTLEPKDLAEYAKFIEGSNTLQLARKKLFIKQKELFDRLRGSMQEEELITPEAGPLFKSLDSYLIKLDQEIKTQEVIISETRETIRQRLQSMMNNGVDLYDDSTTALDARIMIQAELDGLAARLEEFDISDVDQVSGLGDQFNAIGEQIQIIQSNLQEGIDDYVRRAEQGLRTKVGGAPVSSNSRFLATYAQNIYRVGKLRITNGYNQIKRNYSGYRADYTDLAELMLNPDASGRLLLADLFQEGVVDDTTLLAKASGTVLPARTKIVSVMNRAAGRYWKDKTAFEPNNTYQNISSVIKDLERKVNNAGADLGVEVDKYTGKTDIQALLWYRKFLDDMPDAELKQLASDDPSIAKLLKLTGFQGNTKKTLEKATVDLEPFDVNILHQNMNALRSKTDENRNNLISTLNRRLIDPDKTFINIETGMVDETFNRDYRYFLDEEVIPHYNKFNGGPLTDAAISSPEDFKEIRLMDDIFENASKKVPASATPADRQAYLENEILQPLARIFGEEDVNNPGRYVIIADSEGAKIVTMLLTDRYSQSFLNTNKGIIDRLKKEGFVIPTEPVKNTDYEDAKYFNQTFFVNKVEVRSRSGEIQIRYQPDINNPVVDTNAVFAPIDLKVENPLILKQGTAKLDQARRRSIEQFNLYKIKTEALSRQFTALHNGILKLGNNPSYNLFNVIKEDPRALDVIDNARSLLIRTLERDGASSVEIRDTLNAFDAEIATVIKAGVSREITKTYQSGSLKGENYIDDARVSEILNSQEDKVLRAAIEKYGIIDSFSGARETLLDAMYEIDEVNNMLRVPSADEVASLQRPGSRINIVNILTRLRAVKARQVSPSHVAAELFFAGTTIKNFNAAGLVLSDPEHTRKLMKYIIEERPMSDEEFTKLANSYVTIGMKEMVRNNRADLSFYTPLGAFIGDESGETIKQKEGEVVLDLPYTRTDTADELEAYKQRNNIP